MVQNRYPMKVRGNVTHKIYFPNTRCYENFPEKFGILLKEYISLLERNR